MNIRVKLSAGLAATTLLGLGVTAAYAQTTSSTARTTTTTRATTSTTRAATGATTTTTAKPASKAAPANAVKATPTFTG